MPLSDLLTNLFAHSPQFNGGDSGMSGLPPALNEALMEGGGVGGGSPRRRHKKSKGGKAANVSTAGFSTSVNHDDLATSRRTVEDEHHHKHDVICFFSGGREICLPVKQLQKALKPEARDVNPWTIFKILAELINGFEFLKRYKKAASFYGSARGTLSGTAYAEAWGLAAKLSKEGFAIITGGGPGIMEAANRGAFESGGRSVGINIRLPWEQRTNPFVKESQDFTFFFTRKLMLETASSLYIFFPGGFGTLDEFYEMITLVQTRKVRAIPIILVGKDFWGGLVDWMQKVVYEQNKAISKEDFELFKLVDNAEEAYEHIQQLKKDKRYRSLFD